MNTLGDRIKFTRKSLGLSQKAIAEKFGIPQTTWSNYEQNKNKPNFAFIEQLCEEADVSVDWLLFGDKNGTYFEENSSLGTAFSGENSLLAHSIKQQREHAANTAICDTLARRRALAPAPSQYTDEVVTQNRLVAELKEKNKLLENALAAQIDALEAYKELLRIARADLAETLTGGGPTTTDAPVSAPAARSTTHANEYFAPFMEQNDEQE